MESLWNLAQKRQQPDWQYLDRETLDEIEKNKPTFGLGATKVRFIPEDLELIKSLAPHQSWYSEKRIVSSIHGISHALRVMVFALILGRLHQLNNGELKDLIFTASVHDVRRLDDKGDEGHEQRTVSWLEDRPSELYRIDSKVVSRSIRILKESGFLTKLLRTADALDRYRLPKIKWWIDENFLEVIPPEYLKSFAFELMIKSERKILNGVDPIEAVISCLI